MKQRLEGILTLLLVLVVQISFAQIEETITGKVVTEDGVPLPGVNVIEKGTSNGVQTDFDGNYTILVGEGEVLVFSYIGYATKEIPVGASEVINVTMEVDAAALDEVVIVGFGEQTRKSLTSAVAKVDAEEIRSIATPTISGALQGAANGMQVTQNSGAPGGAFSVRVRGSSSINGSNEPLYVIDGVPVLSGSVGSNALGGQSNDVISNINFSTIESIQVLKDASSAAIYGARGANGVVLITTKRGQTGALNIAVNSYAGIQEEINRYEVFTAGQYYEFIDIAFEEAFGAPGLGSDGSLLGTNILEQQGFTSLEELYASDWGDNYLDAIYREDAAVIRQTDVTLSGGSEKARFYTNFTDFFQEGVILGQGYKRRSLTFNANFRATDKLSLQASTVITEADNSRINGDNNIYGALTTSLLETPGNNLYNEDGTFNTAPFSFSNPLQNAIVDRNETETLRTFSTLGLTYSLNDMFQFNSKASLERLDFTELTFTPATTRRGAPSNGSSRRGLNQISRWNVTNTVNYSDDFGDFDINGLLGFSFEGTKDDETTVSTQELPAGFVYPSAGATPITAFNAITENKLFSYFGRVGLSYLDKIFLEGTLRADASSVFGTENAVGYFPAISGAYLISDEDFFRNDILSSLKFRASWGQTGNQTGLGNFGSRFLDGTTAYAGRPGTAIVQLGAPDLGWETTTQTDVGVDLTLFTWLDITYDYYVKETNDLLLSRPLRNSSGFTSVAANVGSLRNKGHELSINARIFEGEFSWTSQLQLSWNYNKITELQTDAAGEPIPIDRGFANRLAVGQPIGAFYLLEADGLYQEGDEIPESLVERGIQPGDVKYIDQNGDGLINANDRIFTGNANPELIGNFRNSFRWKNFDLSANFQFEQNKDIYNNSLAFAGASGSFSFNKFASQLDYWTPENTDTNIPRPRYGAQQTYNNQDSDRFLEDASYIRLKEVVLGYTLFPDFFGREDMSFRVFIGGDNLWTETDYSGLDPEVNAFGNDNTARGTDFFTQGLNKVYKIGFNLKF